MSGANRPGKALERFVAAVLTGRVLPLVGAGVSRYAADEPLGGYEDAYERVERIRIEQRKARCNPPVGEEILDRLSGQLERSWARRPVGRAANV